MAEDKKLSQNNDLNNDFKDDMEELKSTIQDIANSLELKVTFSHGNRAEDVIILHLQGRREQSLAFYLHVNHSFPNLAIEVFNIPESDNHNMIAALVHPDSSADPDELLGRRKVHFHQYLKKKKNETDS